MVYSVTKPKYRPLTPLEADERLSKLSAALARLRPESSDPEKYHVDKSDILRDIGKLRQDLRLGVVVG